MSKLVDKERLAKLAKSLDNRAKEAVATEKERALAAEQAVDAKANANAAAIAAINNEETGLLVKAAADAAAKVQVEKGRAEAIEGNLESRLAEMESTLEGAVDDFFAGAEQGTKVAQMVADININKTKLADIGEKETVKAVINAAVEAEANRAGGIENGLAERIAKNEAFVAAQPAVDKAQDNRLALLEEMMGLGGAEGDKTAIEELQESIDAVEDKADAAQADVDAVEQRLDAEGGLVDRIEANEANIARLDGAVDVEGSVKKQIKDAIAEVNGAAEELADRVEAVENFRDATYPAAEAKVREDFAVADAQVLVDAKAYADQEIGKEKERAEGQETLIRQEFAAADAQVLANAKAHAEQKITELVNSAPDAMNTLKELAEAIEANKGVYDAYVEQHATAMTNMETALKAEIDTDVLAEANRAKAEEERIVGLVEAEAELAREEEGKLNDAIVKEAQDARAAESALGQRIDNVVAKDLEQDGRLADLEEMMGLGGEEGQGSALDEIRDDIEELVQKDITLQGEVNAVEGRATALEGRMNTAEGKITAIETSLAEGGAIKEAIDAAQEAAEVADGKAVAADAKAVQAQNEVDAVELRVNALETFKNEHSHASLQNEIDAVEDKVDALESFVEAHDHSVMEQGIAGNKAAIEKEVEDRDAAIAKALENYSTTEGMKQVIGNVVNSLALTMENDQVVLKLGGVDGIALTSVSLDMATDADIDAIIAGLDA